MPLILLPALGMLLATASAQAGERSAAQTWADTCAYCHVTGIGPPLFDRQLPPALLQALARNGSRQMPAFRPSEISDSELSSLAAWISRQPLAEPEEPAHAAP